MAFCTANACSASTEGPKSTTLYAVLDIMELS